MSIIFEESNNSSDSVNCRKEKIYNPAIISIKRQNLNPNKKCILSFLLNKKNRRRNSCKTADTNIIIPTKLDYNYNEIKRFDELNNSLSDISEFDLEKENNDNKSDFNSSEDENSEYDCEEIIIKRNIKDKMKEDIEYELELEKECEEIFKELNINKND